MARPDFPRTLREFRERFAEEDACYEYLNQSRWPEGMACPRCQGRQFWRRTQRCLHQCRTCGYEVSPIAGTLLQDTHMPIREWFWTAYLVATHTPGLSAKRLQRQLACSYKTAWYMLHRPRLGMVNEARSPLRGVVEADETILGGAVEGLKGRGVTAADTRTLVLGAVEVRRWHEEGKGWEGEGRTAPVGACGSRRRGKHRRIPACPRGPWDRDPDGRLAGVLQVRAGGVPTRSPSRPKGAAHPPGLRQPEDLAVGHPPWRPSEVPVPLPR